MLKLLVSAQQVKCFFLKGHRDRIVPWREISECKSSARAQEWISARLLFGQDRRRSWEI